MSVYSKRIRVSVSLGIVGICFFVAGCPWSTYNPGGFFVITCDVPGYNQFGQPICFPHPGVQVNGSWVRDIDSNNGGNVLNFPSGGAGYIRTDATGHYFVQYGRMPATWNSGVVGTCRVVLAARRWRSGAGTLPSLTPTFPGIVVTYLHHLLHKSYLPRNSR